MIIGTNLLISYYKLNIPSTLLNGLIAYWSFENNFSDSLGLYNGTGTNVTFTSGRSGQAAAFNTAGNKIDIVSPGISCGTNFTVACWIYPTSNARNYQGILCQDNQNGFFRRETGEIQYYPSLKSSIQTQLNTWSHISLVVNNGAPKYFINSVQDPRAIENHVASTMKIIGRSSATTEYFTGNMDEMAVWNRPLLNSEITELYNNSAGKYYPFT